jgi:hypothetical protein
MNTLFSLLFVLLSTFQSKPCVNWTTAKNFDFYRIPRGKVPERMQWPEIENLKHVRLNNAAPLLQRSTCKNRKVTTWMDQYLLVVEFKDGKKEKFIISGYGYFLCELDGMFYYIQESDQEQWQSILTDFKEKITTETK